LATTNSDTTIVDLLSNGTLSFVGPYDAYGDFDFACNETLTINGGTKTATIKGGFTADVIDDPTGGSGKVLKARFEATALPTQMLIGWSSQLLATNTADLNKLYGNMETFSCQFYIKPDSSTDLLTRLYLAPKDSSGLITNQTQPSTSSAVPASTQQGVWHFMSVSDFVPYGAAMWYHHCFPHYATNDGLFGTIYFKDFQLVPGALPNKYIEEQFP
jgi:hypothetical protein